jgi:hypothetical protein
MKSLSKLNFFSIEKERYSFLTKFYKQITGLRLVGKILEVHLSFEIIPFLFATYLKSGGYKYFNFLLRTYSYEGVCIAVKSRGFASSLVIRGVSAGVTFDRFILLFSPLLIKLQYVRPSVSGARFKKKFKAKLYSLKAISQKRLIANLLK